MPTTLERGQVFLNFETRFFLNHIRIARNIPMRKVKMHAVTSPAMAPVFNGDAEKTLVSFSEGVPGDIGEDEVDEDGSMEEASEI